RMAPGVGVAGGGATAVLGGEVDGVVPTVVGGVPVDSGGFADGAEDCGADAPGAVVVGIWLDGADVGGGGGVEGGDVEGGGAEGVGTVNPAVAVAFSVGGA